MIQTFDDCLLVPQYSEVETRKDCDIATMLTPKIPLACPIIAANMDTVCESEMALAIAKAGGIGIIHRYMGIEEQVRQVLEVGKDYLVGAAVGANDRDRAIELAEVGVDVIVIDIAHGHSQAAGMMVAWAKDTLGSVEIIAGNVATSDGALYLADHGADAVKVGIGPGGVCTTRTVTGVGVPQLLAIQQAVGALDTYETMVIADGGIRSSGDIAKALAFGADTVMLGSMLAGTDESPGEKTVSGTGHYVKEVRGMASFEAMEANGADTTGRAPEGAVRYVDAIGPVADLVAMLNAGLRSAMSYTGVTNIPAFKSKAKFLEVNPTVIRENEAHA